MKPGESRSTSFDSFHQRTSELFAELCDLPSDQQAARLESVAVEDQSLADEVQTLLRHSVPLDGRSDGVRDIAARAADVLAQRTRPYQEGEIIGRYRVVRLLAEGSSAQVYVACSVHAPVRNVALKVIKHLVVDEESCRRFEREALALASVRHPHVARLLDVGIDVVRHRPWITTEFIEGPTFDEWAHSNAGNTVRLLTCLASIADGVQALHERGFLHRDLKPKNVLVSQVHGVPTPVIVDLGLARPSDDVKGLDSLHTSTGAVLGTPAYVAPEVIRGELVTTRSDVFALGVMLFEVVVGCRPFAGLERDHRNAPQPRAFGRRVPRELEAILAMALHPVPKNRYASAAALAEDLRHYCARRPVRARPESPWRSAWLWMHRSPVAAAAVAGLLIAVPLLGLGAWKASVDRAFRRERSEAVLIGMGDVLERVMSVPGTDEVALRALEVTVPLTEAHLAEFGMESALTAALAGQLTDRASIQFAHNQVGDAEASLGHAANLLDRGRLLSPHDEALLVARSLVAVKLGDIERSRRRDDAAVARYLEALTIDEELARREGAESRWLGRLTYSYERLGVLMRGRGDLLAAESWLTAQAETASRWLAVERGPRSLVGVARAHLHQAQIASSRGDRARQRQAFETALTYAEEAGERSIGDRDVVHALAVASRDFAVFLAEEGMAIQALALLERVLPHLLALRDRDDQRSTGDELLAAHAWARGQVFAQLNEWGAASEAFRLAATLRADQRRHAAEACSFTLDEALALDRLARAEYALGRSEGYVRYSAQARTLFEHSAARWPSIETSLQLAGFRYFCIDPADRDMCGALEAAMSAIAMNPRHDGAWAMVELIASDPALPGASMALDGNAGN